MYAHNAELSRYERIIDWSADWLEAYMYSLFGSRLYLVLVAIGAGGEFLVGLHGSAAGTTILVGLLGGALVSIIGFLMCPPSGKTSTLELVCMLMLTIGVSVVYLTAGVGIYAGVMLS